MKRIFLSITVLITALTVNSQTIDEAFLYSRYYYGGTARFQAMGAAFTSLGGDLSVLQLNPAGLGLFRATEISFTPQMYFSNSSSVFNGTTAEDNAYNFGIGQFGAVMPLIVRDRDGLRGFNLGYSYNRTNNYNQNTLIRGTGTTSSMADYWNALANDGGNTTPDYLGNAEWLAFQTYVIDTVPGTGGTQYATIFSEYGNSANSVYGQGVRRIISKEGYAAEHSFSGAGNINDKFYFGFTLGISKINNESTYSHLESDDNNSIPIFRDFTYTDFVSTEGTGYAIKLGVVYRPVSTVRVGLAFHSPTVYKLNEYYYDSMIANDDYGLYDAANDPFTFSYTLTTPLRLNAGASLQIGKVGLVSADYEYVDYSTARLSKASDDYTYDVENSDIKTVFAPAHNFRLGGELRVNSMLYVRGGYGFYGSGFFTGEANEDNSYSVYSAGLGFRQSNFYFDLSYAMRVNSQKYFMYGYYDLEPATITNNNSIISATVGFRF
ncbi:MAG: OmpP1/FadL family transporter [Bacteroidales bacterium]